MWPPCVRVLILFCPLPLPQPHPVRGSLSLSKWWNHSWDCSSPAAVRGHAHQVIIPGLPGDIRQWRLKGDTDRAAWPGLPVGPVLGLGGQWWGSGQPFASLSCLAHTDEALALV